MQVEPQQPTPGPAHEPADNAPPTDEYSRALTAGFTADELREDISSRGLPDDELAKELEKLNAAKPVEQKPTQLPAVQQPPTIPRPPSPAPGVYSPEQEQAALRAADQITDPERRERVKQYLKQEYANDAIMDGINSKAREEAEKLAVGQYSHAIQQVRDDPKMPWAQKEAIVKKLTDTMWQDPRLRFGETAGRLEKFMQTLAGIEPTTDLGPGYSKALKGLETGELSTAAQILEMENNKQLTGKGTLAVLHRFQYRDKPDQALITQREHLAIDRAKNMIYRGADENDLTGMNKPSQQQREKLNSVVYALNNAIMATKGDLKEIAKITSPEAIESMVNDVYPPDQRRYDAVNRGALGTAAEIKVPTTVRDDQRSQDQYKWIVGSPPTAINPATKKQEIVPVAGWQENIERLRRNPTPEMIAKFKQMFPTSDPEHIVKALPYVAPPAAPTPAPVAAAPSPGILQSAVEAYRRAIAPPETSLSTSGAELGSAVREFGRAITGQKPKKEEAKK